MLLRGLTYDHIVLQTPHMHLRSMRSTFPVLVGGMYHTSMRAAVVDMCAVTWLGYTGYLLLGAPFTPRYMHIK